MAKSDLADLGPTQSSPARGKIADAVPSIGDVLESRSGVGGGFDVLRIVLAYSVVAWHSIYIAEGADPLVGIHFVWLPGYAILSMFFALSGFLITARATRLSLANFIVNRGLRIVPALLVDVALSAIVLGVAFTTLPLPEYFQSPGFWRYFGNVVGAISLKLPGVFEGNPDHSVNISLWTIPYEIGCYVLMAALILSKCLHQPRQILALCLAFGAIGIGIYLSNSSAAADSFQDARGIFAGKGSRLFMSFLLGIALYLYRFRIAYSHRSASACVLLCFDLRAHVVTHDDNRCGHAVDDVECSAGQPGPVPGRSIAMQRYRPHQGVRLPDPTGWPHRETRGPKRRWDAHRSALLGI